MSPPAVVACGSEVVTQVCSHILRIGGNAVDAAVAAGLAMPMAEPGLASLGGGGFLMLRTPDGRSRLVDFFAAVPTPDSRLERFTVTVSFLGTRQDFHVGPATCAIPGVLAGLLHAHRGYGCLDLADVVGPAVQLARQGVVLAPVQADVLELVSETLLLTEESRAVFAPRGRVLAGGEVLRNADYAAFLDDLVSTGVQQVPAGGPLQAPDLLAYEVVEREPLEVALRAGRLLTNPLPSLGGPIIAHALAELDRLDAVEVADIARMLAEATEAQKSQVPASVRGTTHLSVAARGQMVAMTVSNGSGSGVMVPGTGIHLNNMMGETDLVPDGQPAVAGSRIRSMMAPSLLDLAEGSVAFGTGGSERIRSAMVRVGRAVLDGSGLEQAVLAPRVHPDNVGTIQVEPGLPPADIQALAHLGPLSVWSDRDLYFGGVHAVSSGGRAMADPRRGGSTAVVPLDG